MDPNPKTQDDQEGEESQPPQNLAPVLPKTTKRSWMYRQSRKKQKEATLQMREEDQNVSTVERPSVRSSTKAGLRRNSNKKTPPIERPSYRSSTKAGLRRNSNKKTPPPPNGHRDKKGFRRGLRRTTEDMEAKLVEARLAKAICGDTTRVPSPPDAADINLKRATPQKHGLRRTGHSASATTNTPEVVPRPSDKYGLRRGRHLDSNHSPSDQNVQQGDEYHIAPLLDEEGRSLDPDSILEEEREIDSDALGTMPLGDIEEARLGADAINDVVNPSLADRDSHSSSSASLAEDDEGDASLVEDHEGADNGGDDDQEDVHSLQDDDLVEAQPVAEQDENLVAADPVDLEAGKERGLSRKLKLQRDGAFLALCFVVIVMVVVVAVVLTRPDTGSDTQMTSDPTPDPMTLTFSPSSAAPTMAPTKLVLSGLPPSTIAAIQITDSAQNRAYKWLLNNTFLTNYTEDTKRQRFSLATLYFATDGEHWDRQHSWLTDWPECNWHSDLDVETLLDEETGMETLRENPNRTRAETLVYDYSSPLEAIFGTGDVETEIPEAAPVYRTFSPCDNETNSVYTHLFLNQNNLQGFIPPELFLLSNLEQLQLAENDLSHGGLPSEVGKLLQLEELILKGSNIRGKLPTEIGSLSEKLMVLSLEKNRFTGLVASEVGLLRHLVVAALSRNSFSGSIPSELGYQESLFGLELSSNNLNGSLPIELHQMRNLTHLFLNNNQLSGSISGDVLPPYAYALHLDHNQFHGTISGSLAEPYMEVEPFEFYNLIVLHLNDNFLSGVIPGQLGLLNLLSDLRLQNNEFSGSVPYEIADFGIQAIIPSLTTVYLHGNLIAGTIPQSLGNVETLQEITLNDTNLEGTVPQTLCEVSLLTFDCSELLCGCDCVCSQGSSFSQAFLDALPEHTLEALNDRFSKASMAYEWLLKDPNFDSYSVDRLLQRFALANLRELKNHLQIDFGIGPGDWLDSTSWLSYDVHECEWFYQTRWIDTSRNLDDAINVINGTAIVCNEDGYLEHLRLYDNNVHGKVPAELFLLTNLRTLDLGRNQITGISPDIAKLSALEWLGLDGNWLEAMPSEIGLLSNLRMFLYRFNFNNKAPLPTELGGLTNLHVLTLDKCNFDGPMMTELGGLESLEELVLHTNQFSGPIPKELFKLTNLTKLSLHLNSLSGDLRSELGRLSLLEHFSLYDNNLRATIPTELGRLTKLEDLELDRVGLVGSVPTNIGSLTNMEILLLGQNGLEGPLPEEIALLTSLSWLNMSGNMITGPIPPSYGNLTKLQVLDFSNNSLTSTIINEFYQLTTLQNLAFSGCKLHGTLATEIGSLTRLTALVIDGNTKLSGTIPSELGRLRLRTFNASSTMLSGTVPSAVCSVDQLSFDCSALLCGCDCSCAQWRNV